MDFKETIAREPVILTEGAIIECLKRGGQITLDPSILHSGLIYDPVGRKVMAQLYGNYLTIGTASGLPMMTMAPTWRANPDRLKETGFDHVARINTDAVKFLLEIRNAPAHRGGKLFVGGLMACRGDAYRPQESLSAEVARTFHTPQAEALAAAGSEFLMAATLPAFSEALGLAQAMAATGAPYLISFVICADGRLLDGTSLSTAISGIDQATSPPPTGYMVNCVHPAAFGSGLAATVSENPEISARVLGLQANTSALPHEKLDGRKELDPMAPEAFARAMTNLHRRHGIKILGGCCGTDHTHIAALTRSLAP